MRGEGICPNLRPGNNHRQTRISSKFRRISESTQYAFGIEFALKRSYFYTLIDVSETILENTSVEYPDFASIPGSSIVIIHCNQSKIRLVFSPFWKYRLADDKVCQLEIRPWMPAVASAAFTIHPNNAGSKLVGRQGYQ